MGRLAEFESWLVQRPTLVPIEERNSLWYRTQRLGGLLVLNHWALDWTIHQASGWSLGESPNSMHYGHVELALLGWETLNDLESVGIGDLPERIAVRENALVTGIDFHPDWQRLPWSPMTTAIRKAFLAVEQELVAAGLDWHDVPYFEQCRCGKELLDEIAKRGWRPAEVLSDLRKHFLKCLEQIRAAWRRSGEGEEEALFQELSRAIMELPSQYPLLYLSFHTNHGHPVEKPCGQWRSLVWPKRRDDPHSVIQWIDYYTQGHDFNPLSAEERRRAIRHEAEPTYQAAKGVLRDGRLLLIWIAESLGWKLTDVPAISARDITLEEVRAELLQWREWTIERLGAKTLEAFKSAKVLVTKDEDLKLCWNKDTGTLSLGGRVVRRVSSVKKAKNIVAILDAFEEEAWPARVSSPIRNPDPMVMRDAIRSLNKGLTGIVFEADGTGEGIRWRLLE